MIIQLNKTWTLMIWLQPLSLLPCLKVFLWGSAFYFQIAFAVRNVLLMLKSIPHLVPTDDTSSVSSTMQAMSKSSLTLWLSCEDSCHISFNEFSFRINVFRTFIYCHITRFLNHLAILATLFCTVFQFVIIFHEDQCLQLAIILHM